ncbi:MAG TPA: SET domain-containing protein [Candidatus Paceibacterota bacterium]|nr:SET domain-containing protein [Candidatus Paceibacterota bacterium]HMP18920.1 SET domain-containing protein [Candidatus Paceibacterota bacterium]
MKDIYICNSKIEGKGVYAGENIKKGEFIQSIKGDLKFKINKNLKDTLGNPNWVGVDKNEWIDPYKPFKFLNHSCNANTGIRGRVCMYAIRDIREGEEITIDYSTIEADELWEMRCFCGEKKCRKNIKSIHFLPEKEFKRHMPFISTYFKKLYLKTKKLKK